MIILPRIKKSEDYTWQYLLSFTTHGLTENIANEIKISEPLLRSSRNIPFVTDNKHSYYPRDLIFPIFIAL